jgi:hypothetical protein
MLRALRSARAKRALAGWAALVGGLADAPAARRPDAGRPIADVAGERILRVHRRMVKTLKALQDSLGRFQDREIQVAELHSLGGAVAALENGPAALMAMGRLVDRLYREQADARAEFDERFAAFAAKPQRALVRKTFR